MPRFGGWVWLVPSDCLCRSWRTVSPSTTIRQLVEDYIYRYHYKKIAASSENTAAAALISPETSSSAPITVLLTAT